MSFYLKMYNNSISLILCIILYCLGGTEKSTAFKYHNQFGYNFIFIYFLVKTLTVKYYTRNVN